MTRSYHDAQSSGAPAVTTSPSNYVSSYVIPSSFTQVISIGTTPPRPPLPPIYSYLQRVASLHPKLAAFHPITGTTRRLRMTLDAHQCRIELVEVDNQWSELERSKTAVQTQLWFPDHLIQEIKVDVVHFKDANGDPIEGSEAVISFKLYIGGEETATWVECHVDTRSEMRHEWHSFENRVKRRLRRWGEALNIPMTISPKGAYAIPPPGQTIFNVIPPRWYDPNDWSTWSHAFPPLDSPEWQAHLAQQAREKPLKDLPPNLTTQSLKSRKRPISKRLQVRTENRSTNQSTSVDQDQGVGTSTRVDGNGDEGGLGREEEDTKPPKKRGRGKGKPKGTTLLDRDRGGDGIEKNGEVQELVGEDSVPSKRKRGRGKAKPKTPKTSTPDRCMSKELGLGSTATGITDGMTDEDAEFSIEELTTAATLDEDRSSSLSTLDSTPSLNATSKSPSRESSISKEVNVVESDMTPARKRSTMKRNRRSSSLRYEINDREYVDTSASIDRTSKSFATTSTTILDGPFSLRKSCATSGNHSVGQREPIPPSPLQRPRRSASKVQHIYREEDEDMDLLLEEEGVAGQVESQEDEVDADGDDEIEVSYGNGHSTHFSSKPSVSAGRSNGNSGKASHPVSDISAPTTTLNSNKRRGRPRKTTSEAVGLEVYVEEPEVDSVRDGSDDDDSYVEVASKTPVSKSTKPSLLKSVRISKTKDASLGSKFQQKQGRAQGSSTGLGATRPDRSDFLSVPSLDAGSSTATNSQARTENFLQLEMQLVDLERRIHKNDEMVEAIRSSAREETSQLRRQILDLQRAFSSSGPNSSLASKAPESDQSTGTSTSELEDRLKKSERTVLAQSQEMLECRKEMEKMSELLKTTHGTLAEMLTKANWAEERIVELEHQLIKREEQDHSKRNAHATRSSKKV